MKLFLFNNDEKLIGTVSPLEGIQNEEINKIQTIECTTVYSELIEKASYIGHKDYSDNRIFHLYKIDHVTKTSTTDVKIVGVHTFFDDMESDGYIKDFRPTNREVVGVLTTILDGSRWQLGSVNVQRNYTGNFYYVTRKEAISKLIEATQIEIKPRLEFSRGKITGRYLDVFTRLGGRNGKVFVHGRDLLTVSEKKSQGAIYTAVVGRGKGEETDTGGYGRRITFKDVVWSKSRGNAVDKPAGQEYVEIPAMTELYGFEKGTKPRIKIVEFQDETDKEKLLRLSYEWLEKNSRIQVEYSAKVLNVGNLELGDTVGIFNPKLGIKYETRVFKVKRNLVDNKLTEFGIGDKVTTSPFSRTIELAKEMKNFQDDTVYWLDKIRERLSDKLINEDGYNYDLKADNEYKVPAGYYSFDKPIDQNPTKVVYMGAGKIAIANSKKPTGEWNWKTFLDGTGATLDLINTGVLRAGRIQSADGSSYWDLDTGEFHLQQSAITEAVNNAVNGKVNEIVGEVKKNLPTKEDLKGKNSYLHKKYSDFEDGQNMDNNSNRKYIGIYTGDKEQAPKSASEYSWTKIKGEDGANGSPGTKGADGRTSYFHTAYANSQDGRQGFSTTDGNNKMYVGTYSDFTESDSNDPTKYKWVKIKGDDGRPGRDGANGRAGTDGRPGRDGVDGRPGRDGSSFSRNFLANTSNPHTSSLRNDNYAVDNTIYKLVDNKNFSQLGFKLGDKVTFVCDYEIIDKIKIKSFIYEWYSNENRYIAPTHTERNLTSDKGTFVHTSILNSENLLNKVYKIALRADDVNAKIVTSNARVIKGDRVEPWTIAQEDLRGQSNFIHRKYSNNTNGNPMSDDSNQNFIGIYIGFSKTPPMNPNDYTWSRIKGQDGANGSPGAKGVDGRTSYLHTAYANSSDGRRDFSTTDSNREYLGTYTDFVLADSSDPTKYSWSKIKGDNGSNGHSLTASLWLTGGYVNNVINDVKLNLKVFYDGREIQDFSSVITYKGGNFSSWQTKKNPTVTSYNVIDYTFWSNGEKDGSTLFALATVTYNGLQAVADTRLDNVPDVRLLSETIKKYKTFESTLDGFTSVVGEINTKILSSAYFKNNLNYENVEKTGNDLYFNAKENLVANEYYTILADLDNVPANQQTYMYGASDGGDKKIIQNGLNYWVVKYPNDRGNVNLYPLGANTKVKNVKIYKGDFRVKKDVERENLYSSSTIDSTNKFIQLHLNKNKINGNVYTVKFDASGYSNGDRWDIYNRIGYDENNLTQVFKDKDNEFTFTINDNTNPIRMYIRMIQVGNTKISNVEIYDVSTEYVKNSQVSKLESSIKQTKDEIDLKVSKDNVIASINASVEKTGEGPAQGVVKINADKVDISGVLSAYTGEIGGFRIGYNYNDRGFWLTGSKNFDCGMNPGHNVGSRGAQLWAAWGNVWTSAGPNAWWVNAQGVMTCKATPSFRKGIDVSGRFIETNGNDIQGDKTGGGKTTVVWWSQINKANSSSSDKRLKTNIKPTKVNALDVLNNIEMVEFNWKKDNKFEKLGAIAQQVQSIEESFVVRDMDDKQTYNDYLRISYYNTIPYLIKAVQELSEENNNLKLRLQKLEDKINGNI